MLDLIDLVANKVRDFYCMLGEMTGIGATRHLHRICGLTFITDGGVAISRRGDVQIQERPFGDWLVGIHIHIIFITHAHIDHIGDIPRFLRHHSESWVFISRKAFYPTIFMLYDSLKIMLANAEEAKRLGQPVSEVTFSKEDILNFANNPQLVIVDDELEGYSRPEFPGFEFFFHDSGHDVGAKMIKIVDPKGRSHVITGDVASHDQETCSGVLLPKGWENPDVMITEATNGAKPMEQTRARTWQEVKRVLEGVDLRGGLALFATFMKNRSANMVLGLIKLGYVPVVDGSARYMLIIELGRERVQELIDAKKVIFINREWVQKLLDMEIEDWVFGNLKEDDPKTAWEEREALLSGAWGFHPIVCPSGTLEQGFAVIYARRLLPNGRNAVIFPGYRFPDSVSKQIFDIERGRTIKLNVFDKKTRSYIPTPVNVVADIHHFDFSAHDYQQGLVERVVIARPKLLIVHHCDDSAYPVYVAALEKRHAELGLPLPRIVVRGGHQEVIDL